MANRRLKSTILMLLGAAAAYGQQPGALNARIVSRHGTRSAAEWTLEITSGAGQAVHNVQLDSIQLASRSCRPKVAQPASFPAHIGDLAAGGSLRTTISIRYGGCPAQSPFAIEMEFSGGGARGVFRRSNDYLASSLRGVTPKATASATLALQPGGDLSGASGATVGWGFVLNNGTQWIEITSANFCTGTSGTSTACAPATIGTFTDFISGFNDIVVGPSPDNTSVSQSFNASGHAGIGSFLITAASGQTGPSQIVLTYNLFSRSPHDPNFNPATDTVSTDNFLIAPASVTVASNIPATPAPPGLLVALTGLLAVAGRQYWRSRAWR